MVRRTIAMGTDGRLTIPVTARKALRIVGEADFAYEVTNAGLLLRPVKTVPHDEHTYESPEHRARVERALREPGFTCSEADLMGILEADDPEAAAAALIARKTGVGA